MFRDAFEEVLIWDLNLYDYVDYLLKQVTLIRDLPVGEVDFSKFLPWNLPPELITGMAVKTITVKKKQK